MKDDTIYREDAICAINGWLKRNHFPEIGDGILYLVPSADNEIIGKLKTAIENEEICKNCPTAERITGENLLGAMALGFSYGIEVGRPQGEWVHSHKGTIAEGLYCSNCGKHGYGEKFCPNCGADMRKKTVDYKHVTLTCDDKGNWSMHGDCKEGIDDEVN